MVPGKSISSGGHHLITSSELKAQVSFSDRLLSVVFSSVRPSVGKLNIFIFFSRMTGLISIILGIKYPLVKGIQISNELCTKHSWVKGIQVCSNEGPRSFSRRDINEVAKILCRNLKIFLSRITGQISNKLCDMHP